MGVLEGIRVVDLSWGVAGPMASMLLADNDASVTRVRRPGGDPFPEPPGYRVWQRGKRSLTLDLETPEGVDALRGLVATSDVLLESFQPGVTAGLGIDYATLGPAHPSLVYCSITGYGRGGPAADRPGYDALVAARAGALWDDRGEFGCVGSGPARPLFSAVAAPSVATAYLAVLGISAALLHRERHGGGQWVETSLLQGVLHFYGYGWVRAEHPEALEYHGGMMGTGNNWGIFEAADGWVCNWPGTPEWAIAAASGARLRRPEPSEYVAHRSGKPRVLSLEDKRTIVERAAAAFRRFPVAEWCALGAAMNIGIQPVRSPEVALSDPALLADGSVIEVGGNGDRPQRQVGAVYRVVPRPAPATNGEAPAGGGPDGVSPAAPAGPTPGGAGPLRGIRVVDFGLAVAGPWGTQLLADLGADVIKVDPEGQRAWLANRMGMVVNTGKRSVGVDAKTPGGRAIVRHLVQAADVVALNMRPDAAARLGLDHDSLAALNPRLIYCHTRGFDRGPRSNLPGTDQTANALGGGLWENGGCGRGGRPYFGPGSGGDLGNGFLEAIAITQALWHRQRTGAGCQVDTSILNAVLFSVSGAVSVSGAGSGADRPGLDADQLGLSALYGNYPCAEGWLTLAVLTEGHWGALTTAVPELAADARFGEAEGRRRHDGALREALGECLRSAPAPVWWDRLSAAGVPCEVYSPDFADTFFDDPELRERRWVVTRSGNPATGPIDMFGRGVDFSETPTFPGGFGPVLGQHGIEVLRELGCPDGDIDAWIAEGALVLPPSPISDDRSQPPLPTGAPR